MDSGSHLLPKERGPRTGRSRRPNCHGSTKRCSRGRARASGLMIPQAPSSKLGIMWWLTSCPPKALPPPGFARVATEEVPAAGTSTRQAGTEESAVSGSSGVATTRAPPSGLPQGQPKVEEEEEEEEESGGLRRPAFGLRFSSW